MVNIVAFITKIIQIWENNELTAVGVLVTVFISLWVTFVYVFYNAMYIDLILCYIAMESSLLSLLVLFGVLAFLWMDVMSLVFLVFLISIAACEIAVGLSFLVRCK